MKKITLLAVLALTACEGDQTPEPPPVMVYPPGTEAPTPPPTEPTPVVPEPTEPVVTPIEGPTVVVSAEPLGFATVYEDWAISLQPGVPQPVWRIVWRVEWDEAPDATGYTVHVDGVEMYSVEAGGALAFEYESIRARMDPPGLTPEQAVERDQSVVTLTTWGAAPKPVAWQVL